ALPGGLGAGGAQLKQKPRRKRRGLAAARGRSAQMTDSTHSISLPLGRAPILVAATWPLLNSIRVGMPRTPYFLGVAWFSSMFILATVTLPWSVAANSSRAGAIALQGPHHSAQKSTSTGPGALSTSVSKLASETLWVTLWVTFMIMLSAGGLERI